MIEIMIGESCDPILESITGYTVLLRRDSEPWTILTPDLHNYRDRPWSIMRVLSWREVTRLLNQLTAEHVRRDDVRHAMRRAVPKTPIKLGSAIVHDGQDLGEAFAEYSWQYKDTREELVTVTVNELGGMHGDAKFEHVAPYPVPGYDTAWIDFSPGG